MSAINRRELLTAMLGAPLAAPLAGCSRAPAKLPPGELVGASHGFGHQIRDGLAVRIPPDAWQPRQVVIVGGGIAGLSAARRLLRAGMDDFVLVELEPAAGGTSRSGRSDLVAYPWGAHYVPAPSKENEALVQLFDELGAFEGVDSEGQPVVAEHLACRDPHTRVFYTGAWYEGLYLSAGATERDLQQLRQFQREIDFWVGWRDDSGKRAFAVPMAHGSRDPMVMQLDRVTMSQWMDEREFTSPRLRWFVDYACRDDYGMRMEDTSAWAGLYYFAARTPRPGAESRPFITWPEGNGRLVRHLFEPLRRRVLLGHAVVDLDAREVDGATRIDVRVVSRDGLQRGFRAEKVVFAAPQFLARYLIRQYREQAPRHLDAFQYGAWAVANLHLRERPRSVGFPLAWDNVLYESPSLGYVTATHQRGLDYGPTVLTYYYPLCDADPAVARQRLLDVDREGWAEIALSDLGRAHQGLRDQTERLDVMRWGHAMIRPAPGFISGEARREAAKPFRGIHFAHSDLSGLALFEEAFFRGTLAAEQLLKQLGKASPSIL